MAVELVKMETHAHHAELKIVLNLMEMSASVLMEPSIKMMHALTVLQVVKYVQMIKHVKLVGTKEALNRLEIFVLASRGFIHPIIHVRLVSEDVKIVLMVSHVTFVMM